MEAVRRVQTGDGVSLGVRVQGHGRRGRVLLLHAMMADGRSLDRPAGAGLASTLAAAGYEVWRPDLRGRGLSGPTVAEGGSWSYEDLVDHDVPALIRAAREAGEEPLTVVGHSLGGHVTAASIAAGHPAPDALVLVAANAWRRGWERRVGARLAKAATIRAFDGIAATFGHIPARRARFGPVDEAGVYARDLARYWVEDRWGPRAGGDWEKPWSGRMLCVVGAGDRLMARPDGAVAFARAVGRPEVWVVGEGRYGVPVSPGHMGLVTDPACRPWWERLAAWIG